MKRSLTKYFRNNKGQSVVEFALVLPLLMLILMGIIEFARLWETVNILTSASREGARIAAVTAPDGARVQTAAQNVLNSGNVTGATVTVTGPNGASEVTVTVQFNYVPITGQFLPFIGNMRLTRSTTMHWEG